MEVTWRSEAIVFSFDENCPQNKPISASAHAFLVFSGYLWFSMGNIKVATWNGLKILIPKHMWKSKIGLLEQIWGQNPYDAFFLGHPVHIWRDENLVDPTCVSCLYRVTQKKCPIRILSSNLFQKSDFTFPHVFWNQNFEPYLIFVIFFTQTKILDRRFYTEERVNYGKRISRQNSVNCDL